MKRRLFKISLFLFLGAIVNVAVAWGFVVSPGLKWLVLPILGSPSMQHLELWADHAPDGFLKDPKVSGEYMFEGIGSSQRIVLLIARDPYRTNLLCHHSVGWPGRCIEGALWSSWEWPLGKNDRVVYDAALQIPSWALSSTTPWRWLPLQPIWPGFAINTILYALVVWTLWSIPFILYRILRRKSGLCIKCGYDLRESPNRCPECGWGREVEA